MKVQRKPGADGKMLSQDCLESLYCPLDDLMGVSFSFWVARQLEQILSEHGGSRIRLLRCLGE